MLLFYKIKKEENNIFFVDFLCLLVIIRHTVKFIMIYYNIIKIF